MIEVDAGSAFEVPYFHGLRTTAIHADVWALSDSQWVRAERKITESLTIVDENAIKLGQGEFDVVPTPLKIIVIG